MQYTSRLLYPILLSLSLLLGNTQLASCGRIPIRRADLDIRGEINTVALKMPDFGALQQYVCPQPTADLIRRQGTDGTTITVPRAQLADLLLRVQAIECQLNEILQGNAANASDIAVPTSLTAIIPIASSATTRSSSSVSVPASISSSSLSSSSMSSVTSSSTSLPRVSTVRVTWTTTATTVTITTTPLRSNTTQNVAASSTAVASVTPLLNSTSVAALNTSTSSVSFSTSLPGTSSVSISSASLTSPTSTIVAATNTGLVFKESESSVVQTVSPVASGTSGYTFNALSRRNVAAYFGQTIITGTTSLEAQCADPNIDIVILAFVISQQDGGIYPQVNFGAACGGQTPEMRAQAPGLLSCPELAANITTCQSTYGKKVLLSSGGATSQISFTSEQQASTFGDVLWNLFGPAGNVATGLRPFGNVEVDGFDIDKEDRLPSYFNTLALTLRSHFTANSKKSYYLSSAPQCPFPDLSTPLSVVTLCDFVWVQFYNNPQCEIGSVGFDASVKQWSEALEASTMATKPRLYIGAPAFAAAGHSAYANIRSPQGMETVVKSVVGLGVSNLGGVMFWDGPEGQANVGDGKDIIAWAKEGLTS